MDKDVNPLFSSRGTDSFVNRIANVLAVCFAMALFFSCDDGRDDTNSIVKNLSPNTGQPGSIVTITGLGFSSNPADNLVAFNGVPAQVLEATVTELKVAAPEGASKGMVEVSVKGETVQVGEFKFYNLYAYGRNFGAPTYWKNGVEIQLPEPNGAITDMAISGSDVWAVGYNGAKYQGSPRCWKNGKPKYLMDFGTGIAAAIGVSDSNFHVVGTAMIYSGTGIYWDQGVGQALFSWGSGAIDIALDNDNNVHILAGSWDSHHLVNGASMMRLTGAEDRLSKIVVLDDVVHIAGARNGNLAYWKDGVEHVYKTRSNRVLGLCVLGEDVYISGGVNEGDKLKAAYWKNGEITYIPSDEELAEAIVEVTDDAMYILVNDSKGSKLYKNDEQITPDLGPTNEDRIAGIMIEYY